MYNRKTLLQKYKGYNLVMILFVPVQSSSYVSINYYNDVVAIKLY